VGFVDDLAFNADGSLLAAVGEGKVTVWDTVTHEDEGPPLSGDRFVMSPTDPDVAAVTRGDRAQLWDLRSRRRIGEPFSGHLVAFSPDGRLLAAADTSERVSIRDTETVDRLGLPLAVPLRRLQSLTFDAAGTELAIGSPAQVRIWHVGRHTPLGRPLPLDGWGGIAFSPDGRLLAGAHTFKDGAMGVRLFTVSDGAPLGKRMSGHTKPVVSLSFNAAGSRLASVDDDKNVLLWDVATGRQVGPPLPGAEAAFTPDGRRLVAIGVDGLLRVWDATSGERIGSPIVGHIQGGSALALGREGALIASSDEAGTIQFWSMPPGSMMGSTLRVRRGSSPQFSNDGSLLAAERSGARRVRVWDAATGRPVGRMPNASAFTRTPRGVLLASRGRFLVWNPESGQVDSQPQLGRYPFDALAFAPEGRTLALEKSWFGPRWLWNVSARRRIGPLTKKDAFSPGSGSGLAFSSDGKMIAMMAANGAGLHIWDTASGDRLGAMIRIPPSVVGGVGAIAFSPDGQQLAVSDYFLGTVHLWNVKTRDRVQTVVTGHRLGVESMSFSPDGTVLATTSPDDTVRLWDTRSGGQIGLPLPMPGRVSRRHGLSFGRVEVRFTEDGSLTAVSETGTTRFWGPIFNLTGACDEASAYVVLDDLQQYAPSGWKPACDLGQDVRWLPVRGLSDDTVSTVSEPTS
jgi:WD40 repeat protein